MKRAKPIFAAGLTLFLIIAVTVNLLAAAEDFRSYHFEAQGISLKVDLPPNTQVTQEFFLSSEVLFNSYFSEKDGDYWGYLQIWNIPDLAAFLDQSRSQSSFNYISYSKKPVTVKSHPGCQIEWTAIFDNQHCLPGSISSRKRTAPGS